MNAPATAAANKAAPKKVKALKVLCSQEGFRRAGFVFGAEPRILPLTTLKKEQVAQIKAEPKLVCVEVDVDASDILVATGEAEETE